MLVKKQEGPTCLIYALGCMYSLDPEILLLDYQLLTGHRFSDDIRGSAESVKMGVMKVLQKNNIQLNQEFLAEIIEIKWDWLNHTHKLIGHVEDFVLQGKRGFITLVSYPFPTFAHILCYEGDTIYDSGEGKPRPVEEWIKEKLAFFGPFWLRVLPMEAS